MPVSKLRVAALLDRFPFARTSMHAVWRLTRPRFTAGVIGVLFNPFGEVLVVEHVYHSSPRWGLPGGYVDRGEDPQVSLQREFREELALNVEVGAVVVVERAYSTHLDIAFRCHSSESVGTLCGELLDYRWVRPDQLPDMRQFHRRAVFEALVDAPV